MRLSIKKHHFFLAMRFITNDFHRSLLALLVLVGICGCFATLLFLLGSSVRWLKLYPTNAARQRSIKMAFLASLFHGTLVVYGLSPPLEAEPSQIILLAPFIVFAILWPIYALSRRFYHGTVDIYHSILSVVIGCQFAWIAFVSLSVYCISTMHGNNLATSPHYHGPARIIGHSTIESGRAATIVVAYGGSWACPNFSDLDCQVEISLPSCTFYDQTGLWAQTNHRQECFWSTWNKRNHWHNRFSCAEGFLDLDLENGINGDDVQDDTLEADDDRISSSYTFEQGTYDPFSSPFEGDDAWPYLVSILADCQQCDARIDQRHNRLAFSATKDLLPISPSSAIAAAVFIMFAYCLSKQQKPISIQELLRTDSDETP